MSRAINRLVDGLVSDVMHCVQDIQVRQLIAKTLVLINQLLIIANH